MKHTTPKSNFLALSAIVLFNCPKNPQFTVVNDSCEEFDIDHEYDRPTNIAYNSEEEVDYSEDGSKALLVTENTVEKAYLFVSDAYRGVGAYEGIAKINGVWYYLDIVSEGVAYKINNLDVEQELIEFIATLE